MKSSRDKKMQGVNRLSGRRGVQKSLLCDPGSELRLPGRREREKKEKVTKEGIIPSTPIRFLVNTAVLTRNLTRYHTILADNRFHYGPQLLSICTRKSFSFTYHFLRLERLF